MFSQQNLRNVIAAAAIVLALGIAVRAADPFTLTSTTFKDGQMMPRKVANNLSNNPNCVGENVSPQLSWKGVPDGTKSFAILMEDPEGRGGAGVHHWVAYGIPASVTSFAEGRSASYPTNTWGERAHRESGFFQVPARRRARIT